MSASLAIVPRIWACQQPPTPATAALELVLPAPAPNAPTHIQRRTRRGLEFYRKYTEGMLRRYMRFSLQAGRIPSMLGREMFRGKVTSYKVHSFDDLVIFAHDVEKCLARLTPLQNHLLTRIAIQEYTHQEVATMQRLPRRTVLRSYTEAVDALTAIFLELNLLEPRKECQEGGICR